MLIVCLADAALAACLGVVRVSAVKAQPAANFPSKPIQFISPVAGSPMCRTNRVPRAMVSKLNAGMVEAVKSPDVAQRLTGDGSTPVGSTIEQFTAYRKVETAKWRKVVKDIGMVLNRCALKVLLELQLVLATRCFCKHLILLIFLFFLAAVNRAV